LLHAKCQLDELPKKNWHNWPGFTRHISENHWRIGYYTANEIKSVRIGTRLTNTPKQALKTQCSNIRETPINYPFSSICDREWGIPDVNIASMRICNWQRNHWYLMLQPSMSWIRRNALIHTGRDTMKSKPISPTIDIKINDCVITIRHLFFQPHHQTLFLLIY